MLVNIYLNFCARLVHKFVSPSELDKNGKSNKAIEPRALMMNSINSISCDI